MELADEADKIAMRHFRRDLRIDRKPDRTFVTQVDTAVEKALRERIAHRYPAHGVLAEEFGDRTAKQETRWIIDPIDATHSYLRGIPVFATLIALERAGVMELGLMSAPAMRERWHAVRGGGAWSGKRRLHVSRVSQLEDAQIFYASRSAFKAVGTERAFDRVVDGVWRDRGFGDFWGYMLVAQGSAEAMVEVGPTLWDLAAPALIVAEAGGRMTNLEGELGYSGPTSLASNGQLHGELVALLREAQAGAPA